MQLSMRFMATGVAMVCLAIVGVSFAQVTSPSAPSQEAAPFGGIKIGKNWTPDGEATRAEQMWWQVFQSQDYARTPELYQHLAAGLKGTDDPFTQALMHGRLGWFYLWITAENDYVRTQTPPFPGLPPQTGLLEYNSAAFDASGASAGNGIEKAVYHFGKASKLVMEYVECGQSKQRQDWTQVELPNWGNPSVPRPWLQGKTPDGTFALSWRTFPSVATGFYASFNGSPIHPGDPKSPRRNTISFKSTEDSVSYSLGFNFATNVLGHNGTHNLDSPPHPGDYPQETDDILMLQMMQLAADEMVQDATVYGSDDRMWLKKNGDTTSVLKQQDALFKEFFQNNPAFAKLLSELDYDPDKGTGIWRRPKNPSEVRAGETPANIVKVSSGSSTVVPFNYENNFLLLGDTLFVAYYAPQPPPCGDAPRYWPCQKGRLQKPPVEDWAPVVQSIYKYAADSPVFDDWPFKSHITARQRLLQTYMDSLAKKDFNAANTAGNQLYDLAQNDPKALPQRPSCMVCHMRGAAPK